MATNKTVRKALAYGLAVAVVLGVVYVFLVATGKVSWPGACVTETATTTLPNLSGTEFEVTYTYCDTIAKEEAISVYLSPAAGKGESWIRRWLRPKSLVFRYDPWNPDTPLPSLEATGNDKILISVPKVSSVFFQSRKWRNGTIDYKLGYLEHP